METHSAPTTAQVWDEFHGRLTGFLRKRLPPEAVDDVGQEIFLRIHRSLSAGTMPRDVSGWIYQIARNAVTDHYRRAGANPVRAKEELPERTNAETEGQDEDTALVEMGHCVRPMLDALPEPYQAALRMTSLEGLTQAQAAEKAGVSLSGMKSRVQRGRKMLAESFVSCCTVEFDTLGSPMSFDTEGRTMGCGGDC